MPIRQQQIPNLLTPQLTLAFRRTISVDRWKTYQLATAFNEDHAQQLYLWNVAMGQSFHFPIQTLEIALRNVIHQALVNIYGNDWTTNSACENMLGNQLLDQIVQTEERHVRQYGVQPSTIQTVAALSMGFWVTLLRNPYRPFIWTAQVATAFPHLSGGSGLPEISLAADRVHKLRNRIFHHEPLIGRDLSGDYASVLKLLGWICPDTRDWMRSLASVPKVLRERPSFPVAQP